MDASLLPFDAETAADFSRLARRVEVPEGARLFANGMPCPQFVLLRAGVIRVQVVSRSGREIVLYRVHPGETCVMTTMCLLSGRPYAGEGLTETACSLDTLPLAAFDTLLGRSGSFRQYVFATCGRRMVDLMQLFDDVAFQRMDVRLAAFLLQTGADMLALTHQVIADELGTAREVVSRQLKELERRSWIRLGRGQIQLLDVPSLQALAASV